MIKIYLSQTFKQIDNYHSHNQQPTHYHLYFFYPVNYQ
jgi:hypothetical protein